MNLKNIASLMVILSLVSCKKETSEAENLKDSISTEDVAVTMPDSATIAQAWQEYATPGEAQQMMSKDNGIWNEEVTFWESADAEPSKMTMTAETKMILGGRFQESIHKGEMWGMPFEGRSTLGYNNAEKKYTSTWIDNMSTGIMVMKGDFDPATKTFNMTGETFNPIMKKTNPVREVFTLIDDNTQKLEMYEIGFDGKEFKNMEILMTRKK